MMMMMMMRIATRIVVITRLVKTMGLQSVYVGFVVLHERSMRLVWFLFRTLFSWSFGMWLFQIQEQVRYMLAVWGSIGGQ